MRSLHSTLVALISMALAGCMTTSLQLAEPVGRGNTDFALEGGVFAEGGSGGGEDGRSAYPIGNITVRHGLSDNVDLAIRSGSAGASVGLKRSFWADSGSRLKFALEGRAGLMPPMGMGMLPSAQAALTGVAQWSPWSRVHLLFAPNLTLYSLVQGTNELNNVIREEGASPRLRSQNTDLLMVPAASLGIGVDIHPSARVIFEAGTLLHPALLSGVPNSVVPFSGAIALQWRPRDPPTPGL